MGSGGAGRSAQKSLKGGGGAGAVATATSVPSASPMEIDGNPNQQQTSKYFVNVLELIKNAQAQHGLRHKDYARYRKYCSDRLRRLYKSLKFTHGRGRYSRRAITEATVTDVGFLHIVIYMAERAWAYAMDKKHASGSPNCKQRTHLIGRLRKASKWADLLSHLCTTKAHSRTLLEAIAYASYMKGIFLLEKEENWETALKNFKITRFVYDQLGNYGDVENQILCRNRVEELDPSIRYCLYKMDQLNTKISPNMDLSNEDIPEAAFLKDTLEILKVEGKFQNASSNSDFYLLGRRFSLRNAKTRTFLTRAQQLEKDLSALASTEKKLSICDKIFSAYHDARRHIREDLATVGDNEDAKVDLAGLDKAVGCLLLQHTMERNQLLVQIALSKLPQHELGGNEDGHENCTKPEDLVRLFDMLVQNATDLSELVASGRDRTAEENVYAAELTARCICFQAQRCFYLAKSYILAGKHTEGYALFSFSLNHADLAKQAFEKLEKVDMVALSDLEELKVKCHSEMCLEHALVISEAKKTQDKLSNNVAALSLSDGEKNSNKLLMDSLNVYESVLGTDEAACITKFPPAFVSVPCKPIVLDTAIDAIEFPSLENRLKKDDKKGIFGRWWR